MGHCPMPKVIEAAKNVFWRRGYEQASIAEIVMASGVNRYALYNQFGGKKELFVAALEAYYQERKSLFLEASEDLDRAPLEVIRELFHYSIDEMAMLGNGCLMGNVASEVSKYETDIAERVGSYLAEIKEAFTDTLTQAQARGELNPSVSPKGAAHLMVGLLLGLGVAAKNGAPTESMRLSLDTAIAALEAPSREPAA